MTLNFLDRANVGFAALRMNSDLAFSPQVFGFGAGLLSIGAFGAVPSGLAAHRVGLENGRCGYGGRQHGADFLCVGVFTRGGGSWGDGVYQRLPEWEGVTCAARRRGRFPAVISAGSAVAAVIGGPLAGWLFKLDGTVGLAGWRRLFHCEGLPRIAAGVVAWRWLPGLSREVTPASAKRDSLGVRKFVKFIGGA